MTTLERLEVSSRNGIMLWSKRRLIIDNCSIGMRGWSIVDINSNLLCNVFSDAFEMQCDLHFSDHLTVDLLLGGSVNIYRNRIKTYPLNFYWTTLHSPSH